MSSPTEPFMNLVANSSKSYLVDCGLKYEQFRQCSMTPSSRFLFFPGMRSVLYEFLDLVNGKISDMRLKNSDIFSMRRLKLYPLDDYSVLLIGYTSQSLNKPFLNYQLAIYQLKRDDGSSTSNLNQPLLWTHVSRIPSASKRFFFQVNNRVYMMCMNKQRVTNLHYYDLDRCGKFVKDFAVFTAKINLPIKRIEAFSEFITYIDGNIFAFRRLSRLSTRSRNIRSVMDTYSRILQINTATGKAELVPLTNLDCMKVAPNTYSSESTFEVDGRWHNAFFYLHFKIRIPKSAKHAIHHFAVLNLSNLNWSPIKVELPPNRIQCPLKMLITNENIMILLQFHNTPKKNAVKKTPMHRCREHAKIYKVNFYRIPISQPESLRVLSQLAFNRLIATQPEEIKGYIRQRCANIVMQPVY